MEEQRRCHRMKIVVPIFFEVGTPGRRVKSRTLDVSGTGFSFETKELMKTGDVFKFELQIDDMRSVEVDAQVRWVRKKWQGKYRECMVGVKVIDEVDLEKIEYVRFVAKNMLKFFHPEQKRL